MCILRCMVGREELIFDLERLFQMENIKEMEKGWFTWSHNSMILSASEFS